MKHISLYLSVLFLFLAACATQPPDMPVRDLAELPQDAGAYHGMDPEARLITEYDQDRAYGHFLDRHFDPWVRTEPAHTADEVFWGLDVYGPKTMYGENTLPRDPNWMERMREASRTDAYPSMGRRAIAVVNTSMRVLPTREPAFYDFGKAGEGFPFDYMQNSLVLAGTPLYATHISRDRAWVLVESRFAYGWVPVTDIGWVSRPFMDIFMTGRYGAVTRDDVPILDMEGVYRFTGHIGTLLPLIEDAGNRRALVIPIRNLLGEAAPHVAPLPEDAVSPAPLTPTPANFTRLANRMIGRPYGWGGLYEGRDCSATIMDLMVAFGIYLPRNSSQQIKVGTPGSLEKMTREDKKEMIVGMGTPFLTMIRKPGHIMLYIGHRDGQPVVLHSIWGLKTKDGGKDGRKVIGRTVITTLEPGLEQPHLARPEGILLESVYALSTLPGIGGN